MKLRTRVTGLKAKRSWSRYGTSVRLQTAGPKLPMPQCHPYLMPTSCYFQDCEVKSWTCKQCHIKWTYLWPFNLY